MWAAISGNSMTGSAQPGQGGADFELDQGFKTTIELPGYAGGSQATSAVVSFVQGNNISGGTPSGIATTSGSGGGFTGGSSCPTPDQRLVLVDREQPEPGAHGRGVPPG